MPDQPRDDQSMEPTAPSPGESGGWHSTEPENVQESAISEQAPGWHVPEGGAAPPEQVGAPEEEAPAPVRQAGWHSPQQPESAAAYDRTAEEPGGWHTPAGIRADDLLAGMDTTVYPEPEPEPAPVDEETALVHAPAAEEEEEAPEAEEEPVAILGTEEERLQAQIEQSAAAIAAAMAEKLAAEQAAEAAAAPAPEEEGVQEDAAAIAAEKAAELAAREKAAPIPPPQPTPAFQRLVAQFDSVEARVRYLREQYQQGMITHEALQEELRKLMILDEQGIWWMLGVESDIWYRYEDGQWVPAERPRLEAEMPLGTDAMLAAEQGAPVADVTGQSAPYGTKSIALDEDNMPVVHHVPRVDPEATMVGASAVRFDELPPAGAQATIPGAAASTTAPHIPVEPAQPSYEAPYDATRSETYRRVQEEQARRLRTWIIRALVAAFVGGLALVLVLIIGGTLFYISRVNEYNDRIEALAEIAGNFQTTRIYDTNGNLLTQINDPTGGTRISVPLEEISPYMIHATISAENERFYEDPGWDPIAIVRAFIQNVQEGDVVSGASTITQQLARALVIDPERRAEISLGRKMDEVIIAAEIGRRYTKNEILELYLNEIYYGNLAYGVEAAAQTYFGVSARDLNLPQAAFLAGLVGAPATFDPVTNREAAFARMDAVINFMVERGCIQFQHEPYASQGPFCVTQQDVDAAVVQRAQVEVREYSPPTNRVTYPHFVNFVAQQLEENYGLADIYRAGFNVFTTIDPRIQDAAQDAVNSHLANMQARGIGGNNASVVVMDPRDGRIIAMVGSADYNNEEIDGQVNVAFSPQQPGSSIKPLVYVAAFQGNPQGQYWTPATIIWDTPTCWGGYCPTNYDGAYHGPQSARSALANSYNIPAVKTMDFVTPDRFAEVAQAMGLTFPGFTPQEAGLPGALGAFDVRLYDMVVAYGVFANGGRRVTPYAITRITDNAGNDVPIPERPEPLQVIQPEHAYLITHILSDDVARSAAFGRGSHLNIPGYTVAVKTGTTNDNRDNWTIGYAPSVVVGVWHGNTDNSPMRGTSGFSGAGPIWNQVMTAALAGQPPQEFPIPPGITTMQICADSGTLPSELCLNRRQEIFVQVQPPPGPEQDIYRRVNIDTLTGLVANDFCPNFTEERLFLNISDPTAFDWINNTPAGQAWAAERNIPLPALPVPTDSCNPNIQAPTIVMDWPIPNAEVQGLVEVRGRVLVYNFNRYQLEYGVGTEPEAFALVDGPYTISHPNSELLGRWDVSTLPNGPYTLRLHVITNDGGYAYVDHVVMVNNPLPTATPFPTPIVVTQTPTPTWTPLFITATPFGPTVPPLTPPVLTLPPIVTATPFPSPVVITNTPTPVPVATALPPRDPALDIPIVYGAIANGIVNDAQVATYYRFDGQAGDQIEVSAVNTAGTLDTLIYLMDSGGNIIAMDDDGGTGTDSLLQVTLPATGTYIIVVTRFDVSAGVTSGEYRMTLNKVG